MEISEKGLELIKKFEGCRLQAYQDSVGVWTIGYGTTNADKAITGTTRACGSARLPRTSGYADLSIPSTVPRWTSTASTVGIRTNSMDL